MMHWKSVTSHRVGIDLFVQAQLLATHPVFNWEGVKEEMVTGLESSIGIGIYRSVRRGHRTLEPPTSSRPNRADGLTRSSAGWKCCSAVNGA